MCMHRHDQTLFVVSVQSVGSSFDGASEASGAFHQQRNTFRRSERIEQSLISNKSQLLRSERSERSFLYLQHTLLFYHRDLTLGPWGPWALGPLGPRAPGPWGPLGPRAPHAAHRTETLFPASSYAASPSCCWHRRCHCQVSQDLQDVHVSSCTLFSRTAMPCCTFLSGDRADSEYLLRW